MSRKRNSAPGSRSLFHFNRADGTPAHAQLVEQVKVALALGKLSPGDMLPSIRQLEEELGVGRMLVRKAYQHLQEEELVRIVHGRGAVVTGQARTGGGVPVRAEAFIQALIPRLRRAGLEPVTFSRILHQRLLAEDARAPRLLCVDSSEVLAKDLGQQIQQTLGVHVRTSGISRLRRERKSVTDDTHVLVDYYYVSDVRHILSGRTRGIYPISLDYEPAFVERVRALPMRSSILLLFYESSLGETGTRLAIDVLLERLKDRKFAVEFKAIEAAGSLERLAKSRYAAVIVSNRVWDVHAEALEAAPKKFLRLASRVNQQSLSAVRDRLGLVL